MSPTPLEDLSAFADRSRERFEAFASRFGGRRRPGAPPALTDEYWPSVRELFTRDLTSDGLRELFQYESQETFRFLTREVDLSDLASRPWHQRFPKSAWRFFLAVAYRLSPWRRVCFAIAVPLVVVGWLRFLLAALFSRWPFMAWEVWLLGAATLLLFLLTLELRDKLSLKGDLEVARQIQFGLLPFEPVERPGLRIVTAMRPANTVGGDYFDVVDLGEDRLALAVGDVAGKGMPAALLMALVQGSMRTLVSAGLRGSELVSKLNTHLCVHIPSNRLVTFFYGELDLARGRLEYINAGHNPPLLLRGQEPPRRLPATAMALGIVDDAEVSSATLDLRAGDRLLLYTDGITEAMNPADEEYGEGRLEGWVDRNRAEEGRVLIDGLVASVLRFCGSARPRDDMTLMHVEWLPAVLPPPVPGLH